MIALHVCVIHMNITLEMNIYSEFHPLRPIMEDAALQMLVHKCGILYLMMYNLHKQSPHLNHYCVNILLVNLLMD